MYDGQELLVEFRLEIYSTRFVETQRINYSRVFSFVNSSRYLVVSCVLIGKFILFYRTGPEVPPFDYNGFVATLTFIEMTTEAPTTVTVDSTNKSRK